MKKDTLVYVGVDPESWSLYNLIFNLDKTTDGSPDFDKVYKLYIDRIQKLNNGKKIRMDKRKIAIDLAKIGYTMGRIEA